MRVLHVLRGLHAAGVEHLALQLIFHAPPGTEHHLLNADIRYQQLRPSFDVLVDQGRLSITDWTPSDRIRLAWSSFWICRKLRPDALLIYPCNRPMLWIALGARFAGVTHVAVSVGNTAPQTLPGRRVWERTLGWFSRLGVLPVPCTHAIVASLGGLRLPAGFRLGPVISNGCDTTTIAQRAATALAARPPMDRKRIVMVARLDPIKDQSTLLRAFATLHIHHPDWQLQLVGEGTNRSRLETLSESLGLDPDQILLGRRSDIAELLGQADLFAFSTTAAEGFGIALIEAMAAGLPIVASDVPACREVLLDGAAGDLLPQGDVAAWAARLGELMGAPGQRRQLAEQAKSNSSMYDIRHAANRWYQLLGLTTHDV
jgi:glycosyltransferase involved in cell wall biosynthesis